MQMGSCDPATRGESWNTVHYAVDAGNIEVIIRWEWDGVSMPPNCDGPVIDIRVVNNSQITYYANLPNKSKGLRNIEIPPGTDQTVSASGQLRAAGLEFYSETVGVTPSTEQFQ